jgi:hypothetical protein
VFPFHTLTFSVSVIVTGPHIVSSNTVTRKGMIFLMIPFQKAVTAVQMVTPVLFHELFRSPSYTNIMEVKP